VPAPYLEGLAGILHFQWGIALELQKRAEHGFPFSDFAVVRLAGRKLTTRIAWRLEQKPVLGLHQGVIPDNGMRFNVLNQMKHA
jgi:hypothetical protein